jgi:Lsr2
MKEMIPALWDDLELAENSSRKIPAQVTIPIGMFGEWREIDLTRENGQLLIDMMRPWWDAGHKMAEPPKPTRNRPLAEKRSKRPNAYYAGLREWAAEHDITIARDAAGKYNYTPALKQRYDDYLDNNKVA